MAEEKARDKGPRWGVLLVIVLIVGGVWWYMREQEAQACRRALAYSAPISGYGGDVDAALSLASEINSAKARDCYTRGLISTPP